MSLKRFRCLHKGANLLSVANASAGTETGRRQRRHRRFQPTGAFEIETLREAADEPATAVAAPDGA
jgi:hypothetical protein